MKLKPNLVALAAILGFVASPVLTAEPSKSRPKTGMPTIGSVRFPSYWDAKQWDRDGGANFWHNTSRKVTKKPTSAKKNGSKNRAPQR